MHIIYIYNTHIFCNNCNCYRIIYIENEKQNKTNKPENSSGKRWTSKLSYFKNLIRTHIWKRHFLELKHWIRISWSFINVSVIFSAEWIKKKKIIQALPTETSYIFYAYIFTETEIFWKTFIFFEKSQFQCESVYKHIKV